MRPEEKKMSTTVISMVLILIFSFSVYGIRRNGKLQNRHLYLRNHVSERARIEDSSAGSAEPSIDADSTDLSPDPPLLSNVTGEIYSKAQAKSPTEISAYKKKSPVVAQNAGKRAVPAVLAVAAKALMKNPKVQEILLNKGLDIAGKLVDKQMRLIEEAKEKASAFLKKKINIDIAPEKGWANEDMFVPPGYHIDAAVDDENENPKENSEVPYVFPSGIGSALMNGCWGKNFTANHPCHNSYLTSTACKSMIDGAAFLGVGFDGRGKYSPDARKMSIVQRHCENRATYGKFDVPDTMNVHGIYDTSASMVTFESREEYRKFLQEEAGMSGSFLGFSAGVKEAWGEAEQSAGQKYMAVMDVDVDRYEIFMDEVKPKDLTLSFLKEFLSLPTSYIAEGGVFKYENFIQRWGTHFIKSAKFGGQLEIRKTMDASDVSSKKDFQKEMEMEYKTLFSSIGATAASQEKEAKRKQTKTTSTSVVAQGGSQDIASILSDVYAPTFKTEFKEWLNSIPEYPKPFRFQLEAITDLLNFRASDLFPDTKIYWGCEGEAQNLRTEEKDGSTVKYYEKEIDGVTKKFYCEYESRRVLEHAIQRRRVSLERAIEIYMEQGTISVSNMALPECERPSQGSNSQNDVSQNTDKLTWKEITKPDTVFEVTFDLLQDLPHSFRTFQNIQRNMSRLVRLEDKKWHTSDKNGVFHLYGSFNNGNSKDISKRKISINGLVLTFNEDDGSLVLSREDYKSSKRLFPTLKEKLIGMELAQVSLPHQQLSKKSLPEPLPCKVYWSNAFRLDPTESRGKCLHFTTSTAGTVYVVFATLPKDDNTWYYVQISRTEVATYKGNTKKTRTDNLNALGLGDASLYQSHFVCVTENENSALIEYGKSLGTLDSGDIYLNLLDSKNPLNVRFYAFGNDEHPAKVMDVHIVPRPLTIAECKGDTVRDLETNLCVQQCHKDCDPLAGCLDSKSPQIAIGCNRCRVVLDDESKSCIPECPEGKTLTRDGRCIRTFDVIINPRLMWWQIGIGEFPTLQALTLCMWIKWEGSETGSVTLINYKKSRDQRNNFKAEIRYFANEEGPLLLFYAKGRGRWIHFHELLDQKWHPTCVTWSGDTGVVMYFKNGHKSDTSQIDDDWGEITGGGKATIGGGGGPTVHISEMNIWDKVLSEQEIAATAKECATGQGNVKAWYEWYAPAKKYPENVHLTTTCKAGI